jgi:hypothetical protein
VAQKNSRYSPEFREAAVKEVIDRSRTVAGVARELGLWRDGVANRDVSESCCGATYPARIPLPLVNGEDIVTGRLDDVRIAPCRR